MVKKRKRGIESKKGLYGFIFIGPWIFGVLSFVLIPMIKTIAYSFSDVAVDESGSIVLDFIGLENFKYLFKVDPNYITNLKDAVISFLYSMPTIVILSLLFAIVLNQQFKGRMVARSIFFLPVIISTGVVVEMLTTGMAGKSAAMANVSDVAANSGLVSNMIDFDLVLKQLNFPSAVTELFSKYTSIIFDLIWSCGIQIVLFISGLQTIPSQLYEVSKVEGATKWEEFWYVTIPMLKNVILLVMIYTCIDTLVTSKNQVISQSFETMQTMNYGSSSSMLWMFFVIAGLISALFIGLYYRLCMRRWQ